MTKSELIKILEAVEGDPIVILQKDAEGNVYSPCSGGEKGWYDADSTYSGEVFQDDGSAPKRSVECIVLWPIN